jgi:hypothetical protein
MKSLRVELLRQPFGRTPHPSARNWSDHPGVIVMHSRALCKLHILSCTSSDCLTLTTHQLYALSLLVQAKLMVFDNQLIIHGESSFPGPQINIEPFLPRLLHTKRPQV